MSERRPTRRADAAPAATDAAPSARRTIARISSRVLGWGFERLYHELWFAYDAVSWLASGGRWRAWQRAVLPYVEGRRVLEIGPGPGHLLADLIASGHDVYAVERSPAMANAAARRVGRGPIVRGDARCLPFRSGTFDTVVATFPTAYVRDIAFAGECFRVLRPGGSLVLLLGATSETDPWPGLLERFLAWLAGPATRSSAFEPGAGLSGHFLEPRTPAGLLALYVAKREAGVDGAANGC